MQLHALKILHQVPALGSQRREQHANSSLQPLQPDFFTNINILWLTPHLPTPWAPVKLRSFFRGDVPSTLHSFIFLEMDVAPALGTEDSVPDRTS